MKRMISSFIMVSLMFVGLTSHAQNQSALAMSVETVNESGLSASRKADIIGLLTRIEADTRAMIKIAYPKISKKELQQSTDMLVANYAMALMNLSQGH